MTRTSLWLAIVALALAQTSWAQQQRATPPIYAEYRADAIIGAGTAVQGGAGAVFPMGVYTRIGLDVAAGSRFRDGEALASGRAELNARFLLDPFREVPFGLSLGGGVTVPYTDGDVRVRPYITAVIDVEGRMWRRLTPALQVGLGGGTRVGFVIRTSPRGWR